MLRGLILSMLFMSLGTHASPSSGSRDRLHCFNSFNKMCCPLFLLWVVELGHSALIY